MTPRPHNEGRERENKKQKRNEEVSDAHRQGTYPCRHYTCHFQRQHQLIATTGHKHLGLGIGAERTNKHLVMNKRAGASFLLRFRDLGFTI
jgi:hypothetical protein